MLVQDYQVRLTCVKDFGKWRARKLELVDVYKPELLVWASCLSKFSSVDIETVEMTAVVCSERLTGELDNETSDVRPRRAVPL
jgi:hypothetical protein